MQVVQYNRRVHRTERGARCTGLHPVLQVPHCILDTSGCLCYNLLFCIFTQWYVVSQVIILIEWVLLGIGPKTFVTILLYRYCFSHMYSSFKTVFLRSDSNYISFCISCNFLVGITVIYVSTALSKP